MPLLRRAPCLMLCALSLCAKPSCFVLLFHWSLRKPATHLQLSFAQYSRSLGYLHLGECQKTSLLKVYIVFHFLLSSKSINLALKVANLLRICFHLFHTNRHADTCMEQFNLLHMGDKRNGALRRLELPRVLAPQRPTLRVTSSAQPHKKVHPASYPT